MMAATTATAAITPSYQQLHQRRLKRAIQRANSIQDRATSVLAREFFNSYTSTCNSNSNNNDGSRVEEDEEERWKSLPQRLIKLSIYLEESYSNDVSSGGNSSCNNNRNNNDESKGENEETFSIRVSSCDSHESRRIALGAAVFAMAPPSFLNDFQCLFEALLDARQRQWQWRRKRENRDRDDSGMDGSADDAAADDDDDDPEIIIHGQDQQLLQQEEQLYASLSILGWIPHQLHAPFRSSLRSLTLRAITSLIATNFETQGMLHQTLQWKSDLLAPYVHSVVGTPAYQNDNWEAQLEYAVSECFVFVRMKELFEIVTEYPDSLPAVTELSLALDRTGRLWYHSLAVEWRNALVHRLLHPGAQTTQIIDVYINTIKVLREMDPSGELLQVVTRPVREYLRGRVDTVRCIITSLTEEEEGGSGDLYEELRRHDAKPLEEAELDDEDEEDAPTFEWEPPPSILKRRGVITGQVGRVSSSSRRAGDILSMLVGIYGSKELFVNEYRIMLADKLLGNLEYDTDKEVHNLELLKLRFGEVSMRQCEVMIKDIDDSKRIHANIRSTLESSKCTDDPKEEEPVVDAAIVSHIFWPALQKEQLKNHPRIQSKLDQFSIEYAKLKNPRRLVWMKQLGTVQLEVEVYEESCDADGVLSSHVKEVTCTPAHASLLAHFEDRESWTIEELASETGMSEDMVRKRMGFWVNQRVVQTTRSGAHLIYSLLSVGDANASDQSFVEHNDDEEQEHAVSLGAHEEEEIKVYESYIVSMLSNLGQLPLERIHTMLKTFVAGSDHKYDKTPQQLAVFLQGLCKEEKLECSPDGLYKLLKKGS